RPTHVTVDDRRLDAARSITLDPPVFSEKKPAQPFPKVLDHVVAFELAMHRHVDANLILKRHAFTNLFLDESIVFRFAPRPAFPLCPSLANFFGLRKAPNRRSGKRRKLQLCTLRFLSLFERRLPTVF